MDRETVLRMVEAGDREDFRQAFAAGGLEGLGEENRRVICFHAAECGRAELLKDFFTLYHLHSTDRDERGRTLLHAAAESGDPETIAFCMQVAGFDPLEGDAAGRTPLELARQARNPAGYAWLRDQLGFGVEDCYRNPILRGFHPDPSVVRVGEDYYLVNSSFVLFPGLPVFHSRDLVHWQLIGHAVEDLEASGLAGLPGGYGYWAPDISFYQGKFWVVATLRRDTPPYRLQMITWAEDPRGPWSRPEFLPLDGIDPSLFAEGDRRYILLNPGAILAEISPEGKLISEPRMLFWGDAKIKPEGPHLLKKDGWYYLFLAEGGTGEGHMETVARSRSLMGPYEPCPFNPILGRKNPEAYIRRSGHGKPVSTPDGRWYMVYLCGRRVEGMTLMGRETALDPITWTADGWPMVNGLKGPSCLQAMPEREKCRPREEAGTEEWVSPRNDPAAFARTEGERILMACGRDPATAEPCSLLLRRQREADLCHGAEVDLAGCAAGSLAGLTGYYDERSFYLFAAEKAADGLNIHLIQQIGEERQDTVLARAAGTKIRLAVRGDELTRRFLVGPQGAEAAALRTEYLCDEGLQGGKRFTGALYGLAAIGSGEAAFRPTEEE